MARIHAAQLLLSGAAPSHRDIVRACRLTWQHMSSSCSTHSRRAFSSRRSGAAAFGWHSTPAGLLAATAALFSLDTL